MIQVQHLTKRYGAFAAIQDVTFHAEKGEILGFLGPNGAGKSTTMRILAGCLAASEGRASVAGYDTFDQSLEARKSLGYLPEQVPLYPEMSVTEYLAFAGSLRGMRSREIPRRLDALLPRCGLVEVKRKLIGRLSRGYRQRVGLAQALIHNPPVLILDEPTVGLDPRQIIEVRDLIRGLAPDHTVLLSTHILPEVSMVCDRVVIIDHGHVVAEDTPENLTGSVRGGERFVMEVDGPCTKVLDALRNLPGVAVVKSADAPGRLSRFSVQSKSGDEAFARAVRRAAAESVVKGGWGLVEMRAERVSLEDVFVRLTTTDAAETTQ